MICQNFKQQKNSRISAALPKGPMTYGELEGKNKKESLRS